MLIALEGSSPTIRGENNRKYYVWEAYQTTKETPDKLYEPGPAAISWGFSGINIRTMADAATGYIKSHSSSIFLIGWSRGAAACIQTALDLKRVNYGRNIEAMFLFDAVDQDGSTGDFLNFVPDNVENCYHAMAVGKSRFDRMLFPTCGKTFAPSVNFVKKDFNTSHGGVAGTEGGAKGDDGSHAWMWRYMRHHRLV